MEKRGQIPKNIVVALVIIAIVLGSISLYYNFVSADSSDRIPTEQPESNRASGGDVGVEVLPNNNIEDKGIENG